MKYEVRIFKVCDKFVVNVDNAKNSSEALDIATKLIEKGEYEASKFRKEVDNEVFGIAREIG